MFTFPNGNQYKLLLLDTNILSNICKNRNAEKENFISRFIDKKYAPCIAFQSVLEIYNAEPKGKSPLFESFVEVFSEIPTLLLYPYRSLTSQEIEVYLGKRNEVDIFSIINAFSAFGKDKTYDFKHWIITLISTLNSTICLSNIEITAEAKNWQAERFYYKSKHTHVLYPLYEKQFFNIFFDSECPMLLEEEFNPQNFKAIKMMCITKYDRIHGNSKKNVGKNDISDTIISAYIPYMDAIMMEKHQIDVVRQNISKMDTLRLIERFSMSDIS